MELDFLLKLANKEGSLKGTKGMLLQALSEFTDLTKDWGIEYIVSLFYAPEDTMPEWNERYHVRLLEPYQIEADQDQILFDGGWSITGPNKIKLYLDEAGSIDAIKAYRTVVSVKCKNVKLTRAE